MSSFAYVFVSFLFIFDKIHVCKQNFYELSKRAGTFLTDCWATLTGIGKHYALVICDHGTKPEGGGRLSRVFDISLSRQCQGNTRGLSHIGKHCSHI